MTTAMTKKAAMTPRPGSDIPDSDPNGQQGPSESTPTPVPPADSGAVERIVERFGGIRPMAHKLDTPVTTVQGWKKRGAIPVARHGDLRAAAQRLGITLDEADLDAATPSEERAQPPVIDAAAPSALEAGTIEPAAVEPPAIAGTRPASEERSQETRSQPAPASRSGGGFATAVAVVALIAAGAALTEPLWWPRPPAPPAVSSADLQRLSDRLAAVEQRAAAPSGEDSAVAALEQRLATLEQTASDAAGAPAEPAQAGLTEEQVASLLQPLRDRIAGLEQRPAPDPDDPRVGQLAETLSGVQQSLDQLRQRLSQVGNEAEAAQQLQQQVSTLKSAVESQRNASTAAQALVLATGQLRSVLATSQPFGQELQAVRDLGVSDPQATKALDAVAPFAPKGVPTQAMLADRFGTLASDIVRAERKGSSTEWLDQVTGTLSTLVTVRQQGAGVVGSGAEAVVARAEAGLKESNLALAVQELETLQGPAADVAAGWLADARARLAANQAAQQLGARAIALLNAAAGGQSGAAQ